MSRTENRKVLYLPSTPLNLLLSVAHAVAYSSEQTAQLVLIDQKNDQDNVYFNVLQSWQNSPFQRVELTLGASKGKGKLEERKANFAKLAGLVEIFPADAVAVGSDRRVEFQYVMHMLTKYSNQVEGWYLDDGLYSYAGRPYKWFKDWVNGFLKKLAYGFWWREPKTVGASGWVEQAWLFQPNNAVMELQSKQMHIIDTKWFTHSDVRVFSEQVCRAYGLTQKVLTSLQSADLFLLIPHPNNIKKMQGYEERIHDFLSQMHRVGVRVAAKYHPRTEQTDPLELEKRYNALLVPGGLAFEFVLPFLKSKSIVIGDVGTALLTAQWLRPDLKVSAVLAEGDEFQRTFKTIYDQLGVNIVTGFQDVQIPSKVVDAK
ncbi:MAG: hypothetical protein U9N57_04360 [Pseudomonadota bacterium]|nr:hypothetical protein [Pseudomonadota bacterium]